MKSVYSILCGLLLISACNYSSSFKPVEVEGRYSLEIPSFLTETDQLNDDASLQYQNLLREFYVIVIDEVKTELNEAITEYDLSEMYTTDLNGYSSLILDNLEASLGEPQRSQIRDTVINGMRARCTDITGIYNDIGIYYSIAFLEGKNNYYQIITWTLLDKKSQYAGRMNQLISSFREK